MQKLMITGAALMLAIFSSCQQGGKTEGKDTTVTSEQAQVDSVKLLSEEVMNSHDEGMVGTMKMRNLKKELDSAITADKKSGKAVDAFTKARVGLDSANAAMDSWMHAYDMDMEGKDDAAKKAYLNAELEKVKVVEEKIKTAISEAQTALKK
jgi:hypothetical protein